MNGISKIAVQVHGHRGAAGEWPQNSLQGFLYAVDLGVDALEMDVVISKDRKVVVSHEPYMASAYMLTPRGEAISHKKERDYNLYHMEYSEIKKFDAGSKWDFRFFRKKRIKTYKPTLEEVILAVENRIANKQLKPVTYSVEIKSVPREYGEFQPQPEDFIQLVMQILKKHQIEHRLIIQSFDSNLLNILHSKYPGVKVSYLVEHGDTIKNLEKLNFKPDFYSPHHTAIQSRALVDFLHHKNIGVFTWTVNRKRDIRKMLHFGVDAIISDYPKRVIKEHQKLKGSKK